MAKRVVLTLIQHDRQSHLGKRSNDFVPWPGEGRGELVHLSWSRLDRSSELATEQEISSFGLVKDGRLEFILHLHIHDWPPLHPN